MSRLAIRILLATAFAILATSRSLPAGDKPGVKAAGHQVAVSPREIEPFDLTYLPRPISEIQAITAFRPAAILNHPAFRRQVGPINEGFTEMFKMLTGAEAAGPGIDMIESFILCGEIRTGVNKDPRTKEAKPTEGSIGGSGFVVRTTKPYEWESMVRKWFPCSSASHRGKPYLATPFSGIMFFQMLLEQLPKDQRGGENRVAFFIPDDRTLVIESEERIRGLIDRLAAGKKESPPPGWDQVSRGILAIAIDNHNKPWSKYLFPGSPGPRVPDRAEKLMANASYLTLGFEAGPISRFKMIAVCPHQLAAAEARRGGKALRSYFADAFAPDPKKAYPKAEAFSLLMDALLLDGNCKPTPLGFDYIGEAREDLLYWLAPLLEADDRPKGI